MNPIINFLKSLRQFTWLVGLLLIVILMAAFLLSACSQSRVSFTEEETKWLAAHGLLERTRDLPDESKLKVKEILQSEIGLIKELDSLVIEMNTLYADSTGVRLEFNHPLN